MYWDGMLKMNTENLYNSSESWLSQIKISCVGHKDTEYYFKTKRCLTKDI